MAEDKIAENRRRAAELVANPIPMPEGEFDVILADPPWLYDKTWAFPQNSCWANYPTVSTEHIATLVPPAAPNSACFMWATAAHFPDALQVMEAWGFEYKTFAVWVKPRGGMGHWLRLHHEPLLVGIRGAMPLDLHSERWSVMFAPRRKHSEKPKQVYRLIESMFPGRRCLELFSRQSPQGWTTWGTGEKVDKRDFQLEFELA